MENKKDVILGKLFLLLSCLGFLVYLSFLEYESKTKVKIIEEWGFVYSDGSIENASSKGLYSNVGVIGVVDIKEVRKKLNLKDYEFKKELEKKEGK